jgi:predicted nucleic acid-binding protein
MIYLDSGVIVSALFLRDDKQAACQALCERTDAVTSTHALAEAFATLSGQYRIGNEIVSEAVLSVAAKVRIEPIILDDYEIVLRDARQRGVQGGLIYDALHAQVARRLNVERLFTFNVTNLEHVASDLDITKP